jgi:hypothetical protein
MVRSLEVSSSIADHTDPIFRLTRLSYNPEEVRLGLGQLPLIRTGMPKKGDLHQLHRTTVGMLE